MRVGADSCIDIPAVLLQSEAAVAGQNPNATVALIVLALCASGMIVWKRLLRCPADALGRVPSDPLLGVLAMLLFLVVGSIAASLVGALEGVATIDADFLRLLRGVGGNLAQLLVALAVIGSMWFVRVSETRVSATRIVFSGVIAFLLITPIVAVAAFVINLIQVALGAPPAPEVAHETLSIMKAKEDTLFTMLTLAHVVILVPLAEEAGWRGMLQPSMRRIGVGALGACATTALLFTLVHWSVLAPEARSAGLVMLFILGFALSVLRERTGGIVAPAILHGLFNGANVALTLSGP